MKKLLILSFSALSFTACSELQQIAKKIPGVPTDINGIADVLIGSTGSSLGLSNADIGSALRQALDQGIKTQVSSLTKTDGFFRNELVKILLPTELKGLDKTLRKVGLGNLADKGILALNRTAEDAVKHATPIFVRAVKEITFNDALAILKGGNGSATAYLKKRTEQSLYNSFLPEVKSSLSRVGADKIWGNIINKYNSVPFVSKVNPDLNDYVTQQALNGVFTMIAKEEADIRANPVKRTTALLKKVFALQD